MPITLSFRPSHSRVAFDETFFPPSLIPDSPDYGPFHPGLGEVPRDATILYTFDKVDEDTAELEHILSQLPTTIRTYPNPPDSVRATGAETMIRHWEQSYANWFRELMLPAYEILCRMYALPCVEGLCRAMARSQPFKPRSTPVLVRAVATLLLSRKICGLFQQFHKRWSVFRTKLASRWCLIEPDWRRKLSAPFIDTFAFDLCHIPDIKAAIQRIQAVRLGPVPRLSKSNNYVREIGDLIKL